MGRNDIPEEKSLQVSFSFLTALSEVVHLSVFENTVFPKMSHFPPLFEGQNKETNDTGPLPEPVMDTKY